MAVATAGTYNLVRLDDAEAATGWSNIGGGQGFAVEAQFLWQGANSVNRKIGSGIGMSYDPTADGGVAHNFANSEFVLYKVYFADYATLTTTKGIWARIGSSASDYHDYVISGTTAAKAAYDEYPRRWIVIGIDPRETALRNAVAGTPDFTAADFFGILADAPGSGFTVENLAISALDIMEGLYVTGGTGADPVAEPADFLAFDDGTVNNRYGCAYPGQGVIVANGAWWIGRDDTPTATATEYTHASDKTVLFDENHAAAGAYGYRFDLGSASTIVSIEGIATSAGTTNTQDTRADLTVTGTSGTAEISGQVRNHRNITLTSAVTVPGRLEFADLTQASADLSGATLVVSAASAVAACDDPTFGATTGINNATIIQAGAGHAFEIGGTTAITITNLIFTGFGADTTNDAALYFSATSGTITVNLDGSAQPTHRTAGVTVDFVAAQITTTLVAQVSLVGAEVRIYDRDETLPDLGTEIAGVESAPAATYAFTTDAANLVHIQVQLAGYEEFAIDATVAAASGNLEITLIPETNA